jgi:hypothetical protein
MVATMFPYVIQNFKKVQSCPTFILMGTKFKNEESSQLITYFVL